jgi:hypothetical protein
LLRIVERLGGGVLTPFSSGQAFSFGVEQGKPCNLTHSSHDWNTPIVIPLFGMMRRTSTTNNKRRISPSF